MMASLFALAETFPDPSTVTQRQATTWHSSQARTTEILQQPARVSVIRVFETSSGVI
jgi:hypothetical protein